MDDKTFRVGARASQSQYFVSKICKLGLFQTVHQTVLRQLYRCWHSPKVFCLNAVHRHLTQFKQECFNSQRQFSAGILHSLIHLNQANQNLLDLCQGVEVLQIFFVPSIFIVFLQQSCASNVHKWTHII